MDIFTPLYHEGGLFFLPGEYFSYFADKIRERVGGGGGGSAISFRSFFIFIQICPRGWQVRSCSAPA